MTASPSAFLEFVGHNSSTFSPEEQAALLAFADAIDPTSTIDALTSRLSAFLLAHPSIDERFTSLPHGGHAALSHRGIGGQPLNLTPKAFQTNLRNLVLTTQQPAQKDGGTTPKH